MLPPLVRSLVFVALASTAAAQSAPTSISQSGSASLAGIWVLNPALTVRPGESGSAATGREAADQAREAQDPAADAGVTAVLAAGASTSR